MDQLATDQVTATGPTQADYEAAFTQTIDFPRLHLAQWYHRNVKNECLRWDNRTWMVPILKDKADKIVISKASKIGISELLLVIVMAEAFQGNNGMYVLPTDPVRNRLVAGRFDPVIGLVPLYRLDPNVKIKYRKSSDNLSLKKIGSAFWNFIGSRSPENFYEFDAAIMIYDEYDKCNFINLELAKDRTGSAAAERWIKVGNPSLRDFGIDEEYQNSNKQEWLIACSHCNEKQPLDWFVNCVFQDDDAKWRLKDKSFLQRIHPSGGIVDASPLCRRPNCGKPLDRLAHGEWVAEFPSKSISGYTASRLFGAPGNDIPETPRPIIKETFEVFEQAQGNPTKLQVFYNNRLGQPYDAEGSKITDTILRQAQGDYQMPANRPDGGVVTAGVDVGARLHVQISQIVEGLRRKLWIGSLPLDPDELWRLLKEYRVGRGVIDAQPERHLSSEFCKQHGGWYRCYYSIGEATKQIVQIDHVLRTVAVNRTASIDQTFAEWQQGYVTHGMNWRTIDNGDYRNQMMAPTRIYDEEKERYIWDEGTSPDHHFHADNYDRIAASMYAGGAKIS